MHVFYRKVVLIKKLLLDNPRLCLGIRRRYWCYLGQNWRNLYIEMSVCVCDFNILST